MVAKAKQPDLVESETVVTEQSVAAEAVVTEQQVAAEAEAIAPVYVAMDNLRHDGKIYAAGDVVDDLTEQQAQRLLALGVVKLSKG